MSVTVGIGGGSTPSRPQGVSSTLSTTGWSGDTYSFESTYPHAQYDLDVLVAATTEDEYKAYGSAMLVSNLSSNTLTALGDIPQIDIPIILKVTSKED